MPGQFRRHSQRYTTKQIHVVTLIRRAYSRRPLPFQYRRPMTSPSFTSALTMSTTATVAKRSWTLNRLRKGTLAMPRHATTVETWNTNIASASLPGGTFR